jgi:hypothetical protein
MLCGVSRPKLETLQSLGDVFPKKASDVCAGLNT